MIELFERSSRDCLVLNQRRKERERDSYSQLSVKVTGAGQQARPSLCTFILKELKAAECEDLACETTHYHLMMCATYL